MKLNTASAVGSSLSRLMKPEPGRFPIASSAVMGPGFSNKNSTRASMPRKPLRCDSLKY